MGSIAIKTKIPGPRSRRLLKLKEDILPRGIATLTPVFIERAKGALIMDVDGNVLIDFSSGVGATNSGHGVLEITDAVKRQSDKFFHTYFPVIGYESYIRLCDKLNKITPGNFRKKTALFTTGAEAVENAIKIARRYTHRQAVVSFTHGFHGRTLLTMSMTSKIKPYKFGFGPFAPETYKLEYPYAYRRPSSCMTEDDYVDYLLEQIEEEFFAGVAAPEDIACIVMELVAGEGGFIVAPKRYVNGIAKICKKYGILLVIDEVQTGFGRTGTMFASEQYGIEPDMIITAKSLSNGMPLSAVTGKKDIMDSVQEGGLGGTFMGNPLSCEAALATIEYIQKHKLPERAKLIGEFVRHRFNDIMSKCSIVGDVRGLGAMNAVEVVKDKINRKPDRETADKIIRSAYENGLILLSSGILGNDIRALMPLTMPYDQLEEGLDVLEKCIMKHSK